jgi:type IV pilus assembly protein PilC
MSDKFEFKAINNEGRELNGVREANDRFALARDLRAENLVLVSAKVVSGAIASGTTETKLSLLDRLQLISIKDRLVFIGSLAAMIGAGLSLTRALAVMERQTTNTKFKFVIRSLINQINEGKSLNQAMTTFPKVFPAVLVAMVAVGEESGRLAQALETARLQLNKSYDLRRKIKGALMYPGVIIAAIIVIAALMMVFVVPSLTQFFSDFKVQLPWSTRFVIGLSNFLGNHYLLVLIGVIFLVWLFLRLKHTKWGNRVFTRVIMRLPVIATMNRNFNAAVTMRTLASLLGSGVSMVESVRITSEVTQNPFYFRLLQDGLVVIQQGLPLSGVLKGSGTIYPPLVGELVEVGEETGNLPEMLLRGATFFEDEVDQATKSLSTIIEPVLMIIVGVGVGFFAVSMIYPLYSLSNAI